MKSSITIIISILISLTSFSQDCGCGKNGFGSNEGDVPEFTFTFPDSTKLAFCGYLNKKETDSSFFISEFNIFSCDSSMNLLGYSAVHYCNVFYRNDSVFINRLKAFPTIKGAEWTYIPFSQRRMVINENGIDISQEEVILEIPEKLNFDVNKVLSGQYEKMNYEEISEFLGQLILLALKENESAVNILFSDKLDNFCDAAVADHLRDCKEMYNWAVKGMKSKRHWR
jgi:hypothetical protein